MIVEYGFLPDTINSAGDDMPDALRFDLKNPADARIERIWHADQGFERIALSPARWRDVCLTARYSDRIIEHALDSFRWQAGAIVVDFDAVLIGCNRDHRSDAGLLASVQRVVDQLFEDNERPVGNLMAGLRDKLFLAEEVQRTTGAESGALELLKLRGLRLGGRTEFHSYFPRTGNCIWLLSHRCASSIG